MLSKIGLLSVVKKHLRRRYKWAKRLMLLGVVPAEFVWERVSSIALGDGLIVQPTGRGAQASAALLPRMPGSSFVSLARLWGAPWCISLVYCSN